MHTLLHLNFPSLSLAHHMQVAPDLATSEQCVACYQGSPLLTSAGPATVKSIAGGSIR